MIEHLLEVPLVHEISSAAGDTQTLQLYLLLVDMSMFKENEYNYIFDRGCFHVLDPSDRLTYVREIKRILKEDGTLFLKCFSINEKREEGPYRFSKRQISEIFEKESFKVTKIKDTVYQGTLDPLPAALFVVIKNSKKR